MKLRITTIQIVIIGACFLVPCYFMHKLFLGDKVDDVLIDGGLSLLHAWAVVQKIERKNKNKNQF